MDADTLMKRLHELEEENKRLKSLLAEHGTDKALPVP